MRVVFSECVFLLPELLQQVFPLLAESGSGQLTAVLLLSECEDLFYLV